MRKFIKNFADITHLLMELTKESTPWNWNSACQTAFEILKEKLTSQPVLAHPQFDKKFYVATDASDTGMGAVLMQERPDHKKGDPMAVVMYISKKFTYSRKIPHDPKRNASNILGTHDISTLHRNAGVRGMDGPQRPLSHSQETPKQQPGDPVCNGVKLLIRRLPHKTHTRKEQCTVGLAI
jgi:hypothetical protein